MQVFAAFLELLTRPLNIVARNGPTAEPRSEIQSRKGYYDMRLNCHNSFRYILCVLGFFHFFFLPLCMHVIHNVI